MKMKTESREVEVKDIIQNESFKSDIVYNDSTQRWEQTSVTEHLDSYDYVVDKFDLYDSTGKIIGKHSVRRKEMQTIQVPELDEHNRIIWEDSEESELEYKIRYINTEGEIITEDQYNSGIVGIDVFKAAFVGVTYHCG